MSSEQSHSKLNVGRCSAISGRPPSKFDVPSLRIDKWLWAVRVYKTRSDASEACRGSAVRVNNVIAKPSNKVRIGDTIIARTKAITKTLYVIGLTEKRVGAPAVAEYYEDRTPESDLEAAREKRANARLVTHKGGGRPTKKDRRNIEKLLEPDC
ncbi:MAG: RNA-binding S4 domain-containing protein [Opitutaceae bacterium]